jgi:hypothetical protein
VSTTAAYPEVDYTATVRRPRFDELPAGVQAAIGTASGAPVVSADDPPRSGFTGGFAAVVHLADGGSVFAKAGSSVNPHLVAAYAQEAVVLQRLPMSVPAPRLVGAASLPAGEVDEHQWQVIVAEAVAGALPQPWTDDSVGLVHQACLACVEALTPAPAGMELASLAQRFGEDPAVLRTFPDLRSGALELTWGQPAWVPERCTDLAELVLAAATHLLGETACHGDLRADNTLFVPAANGSPARAVLVDWNWLRPGRHGSTSWACCRWPEQTAWTSTRGSSAHRSPGRSTRTPSTPSWRRSPPTCCATPTSRSGRVGPRRCGRTSVGTRARSSTGWVRAGGGADGPGRQRASADLLQRLDHGGPCGRQGDAGVGEGVRDRAGGVAHETQQHVLRADLLVTEGDRLA